MPPAAPLDADGPLTRAWQTHAEELTAFARRRLASTDAAEEAVQESFAAACVQANFGDITDPRAWLFRVLRRKVVDRIRREAADGRAAEEVAKLASEPNPHFHDGFFVARPEAWGNDPLHSAEAGEFWTAFDAAVDALPLRMRQAFVLRELDGEPTEAVCESLGITSANLWTLIHRARQRLKDALGDYFKA